MKLHFLIVQLGSEDLMEVALASIDRFAGECNVDIVKLPDNTSSPRAHGEAIDHWRRHQQVSVMDSDVVVLMDPDVVLLSDYWRKELDLAFKNPLIGIWGAGSREDFGPRVHASMFAVRGSIFNTLERSFTPCLDLRERIWRDTGGLYCMWVKYAGWDLKPVERDHASDWCDEFSQWRAFDGTPPEPPMWSHLGGGSHSDPKRLTWWQRQRRHRQIAQRRRWLRAAKTVLES